MTNNKKIIYPFFIAATMLSQTLSAVEQASASEERGAQILEMQLQRAQRLTELEYQAEVLERQARIAKAQEQIDKTVGLEDTDIPAPSQPKVIISAPVVSTQNVSTPKIHALPQVVELSKNHVKLQFENGFIGSYSVGDTLLTGHRIKAISMVEGVQLQTGNTITTINYRW